MKILIALNTSWNLVNFRAGLIRSFVNAGHEVVAVAPLDSYSSQVSALGARYSPLEMDNRGIHPGRDFLLLWGFFRILRAEQPSVLLLYTVKPNVYGSFVARLLGIPVINNVAGLGAVFIKGGWLSLLVMGLYKFALSHSRKVFFQNDDDRQFFIKNRLVPQIVTDLLPGSGVDLERFSPVPFPAGAPIRFLLTARMLWDKGVGEYVEAARLLKQKGIKAEFFLLGFIDVQNPAAISRQQVNDWIGEGAVCYMGVSDDVREEIAKADCVVLPSYREGTPRTLLEAAAMARPIVTTDAVGCREVVEDGVNGYLCRPRDAKDLAEKMQQMVALSSAEREEMGRRGRAKIEREFDERIVVNKYLEAIDRIFGKVEAQ